MNAAPTPFQSASLYVGDLHPEATEGLLFELFSRVGPVASIRVCRDAVTRRSLGYAYVNFHNVQDAERALDTMNFTDIKEKQCRIMWSQRDPTLRKSGVGNVFIKNLATTIDNKSLFDTFSVFGNILSCKVITDESGNSKGYGYVHYETAEAAQDSIKKLDGCQIEGQTVNVLLYSRRTERAGNNDWTNIYVKQFPLQWKEENLAALLNGFGNITSLVLSKDADGNSKGFGFVNYETHAGAAAAIADLHNKTLEVDGSSYTLYASQAQKKSDRTRELKRHMESVKHDKILKLQGMNLFVKNLDDTINDDKLRELFAPFGTITSARVMFDEAAGNISKGFGFVCYSSAEEAAKAIAEMNNKVVLSKPVTVVLHQRKDVRQAQLAATFNARAAMGGMGRGVGGFPGNNGQGPMAPFMMFNQAPPQDRGYMMGGRPPFNAPGGRGMMPPGGPNNAPYPIPAYAMQQMRPPQGGFPPNPNMMMPGRGVGGRGPVGGRGVGRMMPGMLPPQGMRGPMPGVKFNMQARNQPNQGMMQMGGPMMGGIPPMGMQQGQMMGMPMDMGMQQQLSEQQAQAPLDEIALAQADPQMQKYMIGERLYPLISQRNAANAGKITGMLLEMDNAELLHLIESPESLAMKIEEAVDVLRKHNLTANE